MKPRTLVVGEALIDVVREPDGSQREHPGGSPMNVAIGLARLGHECALSTWLGDDSDGRMIEEHLARDLVPLARTQRHAERTARAVAVMDERGSATYEFDLTWDVDDTDEPYQHVHTGSIAAVLQPGADRVRAILQRRRPEATVSYDPNARPALMGSPEAARVQVEGLVALADVVKASDEDVAWLYGDRPETDVMAHWASLGPALVVLTRGEHGALVHLAADGATLPVAGRRTTVADTIGAGDSFMAALLSGLLDQGLLGGQDGRERLREATREQVSLAVDRAVLASSITVSRHGAQPPRRDELG